MDSAPQNDNRQDAPVDLRRATDRLINKLNVFLETGNREHIREAISLAECLKEKL